MFFPLRGGLASSTDSAPTKLASNSCSCCRRFRSVSSSPTGFSIISANLSSCKAKRGRRNQRMLEDSGLKSLGWDVRFDLFHLQFPNDSNLARKKNTCVSFRKLSFSDLIPANVVQSLNQQRTTIEFASESDLPKKNINKNSDVKTRLSS